jgi:hypothetical protein
MLTINIYKLIKNMISVCILVLKPHFSTLKSYIYVVFYAIMTKYVAFYEIMPKSTE